MVTANVLPTHGVGLWAHRSLGSRRDGDSQREQHKENDDTYGELQPHLGTCVEIMNVIKREERVRLWYERVTQRYEAEERGDRKRRETERQRQRDRGSESKRKRQREKETERERYMQR